MSRQPPYVSRQPPYIHTHARTHIVPQPLPAYRHTTHFENMAQHITELKQLRNTADEDFATTFIDNLQFIFEHEHPAIREQLMLKEVKVLRATRAAVMGEANKNSPGNPYSLPRRKGTQRKKTICSDILKWGPYSYLASEADPTTEENEVTTPIDIDNDNTRNTTVAGISTQSQQISTDIKQLQDKLDELKTEYISLINQISEKGTQIIDIGSELVILKNRVNSFELQALIDTAANLNSTLREDEHDASPNVTVVTGPTLGTIQP